MKLWMHLAGNAALLALGYYWLGIGEASAGEVVWSAAVGLIIVAGACALYGAAIGGSVRHLHWTVIVAVLAFAAYMVTPSSNGWWIVRWVVLPMLFVPLFAGAALHGRRVWRGFSLRALTAPLFALAGVWVPLRLLNWTPHLSSFAMEMTSFVLRAAAAYLLFVLAWLWFAHWMSGGNPRVTQARTVSLP